MHNTSKTGVKHAKKHAGSNSEPMVTDFGNRTISTQNFSKIVALPKTALINCGIKSTMVNVKLVQQDGERFLKLTPIAEKKKEVVSN
jgi:hypothetical protein